MTEALQPLSHLAAVLECLLFTAETPLSLNRIAEIFPNQSPEEWRTALEELTAHYDGAGHGLYVVEVAGGYQLRTRSEYASWIVQTRPANPQRLSQAALETLAVIAYKQPIIRAEIEAIRGVDASGVLRQLLEKGLIQMLGRKDIAGRPILYGTTATFLEVFGLKDLRSLPTQEELQALAEEELAHGGELYGIGSPALQMQVSPDADDPVSVAVATSGAAAPDSGDGESTSAEGKSAS